MVLLFALLMAAQSPAAEETPSPAEAAALIASCNARKFETTIHVTVAGKPKSSLVKLCGTVGQTDAEWRRTLTDAAAKVAANPRMSPDAKQQIIAALNLEIAKLPLVTSIALPPARPAASAPTPPPVRAPLADTPEYSTLPPLPAPKPAVTSVALAAAPPPLPAPRLTFRCLATSSLRAEGPCDLLERDTLLMVRADENIAAGTSLRFLRRGDDRGEIDLPVLRAGQVQRFSLPPRLCAGVAGSRVEIQVLRSARGSSQVVDTRGPFELRC